ncbi:MAG: hypothetical protein ABIQ39_04270 [Ilumatobacteraceae bacterium]
MIRHGASRAAAEADLQSHTITRWFGADSVDSTPDVVTMSLRSAGWVLVCSDGLWNYASTTQQLGELVAEAVAGGRADPTEIAGWLVDWANVQGGHDNITAALARFEPSLR